MEWTEDGKNYGRVRKFVNKHPWAFVGPVLIFGIFGWVTEPDDAKPVARPTVATAQPMTPAPVWGPDGGPSCERMGGEPRRT